MLPSIKSRQRQITAEIAKLGPCLPGNRKVGQRTVTRTLKPTQAERYRPMFDNARRMRQLVSGLDPLKAQQIEQGEGWT